MMVLCLRRTNKVYIEVKRVFRPNLDMIQRILRVAVPNVAENGLFQAAKVVLGSVIASFGTAQITANSIGHTIWSLAACVGTSMSPAFVTVIGQCVGSGDMDAADYYLWKLIQISTMLSAVWNLLILALLPVILPLYDISAETAVCLSSPLSSITYSTARLARCSEYSPPGSVRLGT